MGHTGTRVNALPQTRQAAGSRKRQKFRLVSAFWGDGFVDTFLRVALRSLMAEGNVLDLARENNVVFSIYTTRDAAEKLQESAFFRRLQEAVDVRLLPFALTEIDAGNFGSHNIFWKRGIEIARRNREILVYIIPDVIYSAGTLLRWAERFADGARALYTPGLQAAIETLLPELEARFGTGSGPIALDASEIPQLLFKHFHPIHSLMRPGRSYQPAHPEADFRIVQDRGIVWREFTAHPHALDPSYFNTIEAFNPRDHLDAMHFEPCSIISLEPLLKRSYQYYRPRLQDDMRLSNMGDWHNHYAGAAGVRLSANPFEFCIKADLNWTQGRSRAIAEGRLYRAHLIMASRIFSLFAALRSRGMPRAAEILAAANFLCRLRRRICVRRKAIILAPSEAALEREFGSLILPLMAERPSRQSLFALIADHVILPPDEKAKSLGGAPEGAIFGGLAGYRTARGLPVSSILAGVRVVGEAFDVGPFTVYPIDRVLKRDPARSAAENEWLPPSERAEIRASDDFMLLPESFQLALQRRYVETATSPDPRWTRRYRGTYGVTEWARRSFVHRIVHAALHVPILEPLVGLVFPVYFKPEIGAVGRRVVQFLRRVTGNIAAFARRVGNGLASRSPVISLVRRGVVSLRRDGVRATLAAVRRRLGKSPSVQKTVAAVRTSILPIDKLHSEDAALLDAVRGIRSIDSAINVLAEFERAFGSKSIRSAPLALAQEIATREGVAGEDGQKVAEKYLSELIKKYPSCAEAWLELAFLREDQNEAEAAVVCLRRAMDGVPHQDVGPFFHDPRDLAGARLTELLLQAGRQNEAIETGLKAFENSRADPFAMLSLRLALTLCASDQPAQALRHFVRAMHYEEFRWRVPSYLEDIRDFRVQPAGTKAEAQSLQAAE